VQLAMFAIAQEPDLNFCGYKLAWMASNLKKSGIKRDKNYAKSKHLR
jgi:hypothetical protein